jgi:hypothetical protein
VSEQKTVFTQFRRVQFPSCATKKKNMLLYYFTRAKIRDQSLYSDVEHGTLFVRLKIAYFSISLLREHLQYYCTLYTYIYLYIYYVLYLHVTEMKSISCELREIIERFGGVFRK